MCRPQRLLRVVALVALVASMAATWASAQDLDVPPVVEGAEGSADELAAWNAFTLRNHVRARELSEAVLGAQPRSFLGHFVLGLAQHYGEANLPRALYHERRALALYEAMHSSHPGPDQPWRWHVRMLRELALTEGDVGHHAERLDVIAEHNALYDPDITAERAWTLMKMGRFEEARVVARGALAAGDPSQSEVAMNALCAIEFEGGSEREGYDACRAALDFARRDGRRPSVVDLTNFAESARLLFRLDESERALLEATRMGNVGFGNPWLDLAELYTREARYPEALDALKQIPAYRNRRPAHVRNADRNESWRAQSTFFLAVGRPADALRVTERAMVMPDRRAHNSRDPAQDRAVVALLDRRARRMLAETAREQVSARSLPRRGWTWLGAGLRRIEAWRSGRVVARLLADSERLVGTFRIGTSQSGVLQPWMAGDLVDVLGAGVVRAALSLARARDLREDAGPYYDAVEAEVCLALGEFDEAVSLGRAALDGLSPGEAMLRARVEALLAESHRERGELATAAAFYDGAFQRDPGVFRRLEFAIPVRVDPTGDAFVEAVGDALARSPRFEEEAASKLSISVRAASSGARICLQSSLAVIGCVDASPEAAEAFDEGVQRVVDAFHAEIFAPRIDLSQADANSLDGSHRVERDPLRGLFGGAFEVDGE